MAIKGIKTIKQNKTKQKTRNKNEPFTNGKCKIIQTETKTKKHTHTHIKPKQSKENKVQGMIWQAKETKNDTTN